MYKGVTPTITLTFDDETLDLRLAETVIVSISNSKEGQRPILEITDLDMGEKTISFDLTQEQTLAFPSLCRIQANWTYSDGKRACSDIKKFSLSENLHCEVMA